MAPLYDHGPPLSRLTRNDKMPLCHFAMLARYTGQVVQFAQKVSFCKRVESGLGLLFVLSPDPDTGYSEQTSVTLILINITCSELEQSFSWLPAQNPSIESIKMEP